MKDPRIHAALVCALRGCPPLRQETYTEASVDEQLTDNARKWLRNRDLNEFVAGNNTANVTKSFDWYRSDFEKDGGSVWAFLAKIRSGKTGLPNEKTAIRHKSYHWGLDDVAMDGARRESSVSAYGAAVGVDGDLIFFIIQRKRRSLRCCQSGHWVGF